jgi:hypothetical protein
MKAPAAARTLPPAPAQRSARRLQAAFIAALLLSTAAPPAAAQDLNFTLPVQVLEQKLRSEPFTILDWRGARRPEDRTQRIALTFEDSATILAQWATAPSNGGTFNNQPRFELAAYEIQKLFLDEGEYVVPPTTIRAFPLEFVREYVPGVKPTFQEAPASVVAALQYWLTGVRPDNFWNPARARSDTVYARHIGNLNILTYLINHNDSNVGNFLISESEESPRVFAVDNGVAFSSQPSNRGSVWRELNVTRLPRHTVERLRTLKRADLERVLGVLVEFRIEDGHLVPVEPGANMSAGRGVRRSADRIQFGLTSQEIRQIDQRLHDLLRMANGMPLF